MSKLNTADATVQTYVLPQLRSVFLKRIFLVTALANVIGINASLMRQYKTGNAKAGEMQKKKIEKAIHSIAKELSVVRL